MDTLRLVDPAAREIVTSIAPFDPATQTAEDHRGFVAGLYTPPSGAPPLSGEVRLIAGGPGQPPVRVLVYRPAAAMSAAPAILYFHGGGLTAGSPDMMDAAHRQLAEDNGAVVVAVTYRLAPETPFPGAVEDGCAALDWLFNQAAALGVDTDRIALMGHSAGGGLAAATALLARDRGRRRPAAQFLIYPMLDPRTGTPDAVADNPFTGQFMWTRAANRFGWDALRGGQDIAPEQLGWFGPALAASVAGLPSTFIAVGALDLFLEEDAAFALRLAQAGVPVELHVYPGGVHGFDAAPGRLAEQFAADLRSALDRWLRRS